MVVPWLSSGQKLKVNVETDTVVVEVETDLVVVVVDEVVMRLDP